MINFLVWVKTVRVKTYITFQSPDVNLNEIKAITPGTELTGPCL